MAEAEPQPTISLDPAAPSLAHAVGTPTTIVLAYVQLLQRRQRQGTLDGNQLVQGLAAIEAAAHRLASVAERLERGDES